jgi:hypothetical protein
MGQKNYVDTEGLESLCLEELLKKSYNKPDEECCKNETKKCCQEECTCDKENECKKFFLTGCSGELFLDDTENDYQEIKLIEPTCSECDSHVALTFSSVDRKGKHIILNEFKDKRIKITIEVV